MDESELEALRELSRAAFQQRYRLEIMLAIADSEDGLVTLSDLASQLGLSTSNVQGSLRSLLDTGLLSELPTGQSKRKFLVRNPSAAWRWAVELRAHAQAVCKLRPSTTQRVRALRRSGSTLASDEESARGRP